MQGNDERREDEPRGGPEQGDQGQGGQVSSVSGMGEAADTTGTQETTPPADLTQQRAQGPGRDYREDAVDNERGEQEVMPRDNT